MAVGVAMRKRWIGNVTEWGEAELVCQLKTNRTLPHTLPTHFTPEVRVQTGHLCFLQSGRLPLQPRLHGSAGSCITQWLGQDIA